MQYLTVTGIRTPLGFHVTLFTDTIHIRPCRTAAWASPCEEPHSLYRSHANLASRLLEGRVRQLPRVELVELLREAKTHVSKLRKKPSDDCDFKQLGMTGYARLGGGFITYGFVFPLLSCAIPGKRCTSCHG